MRWLRSSVAALALFTPATAPAQFEAVTLEPGFEPDPVIAAGISGGPAPVEDVTGTAESPTGPCAGFIDTTPDHTVALSADFAWLAMAAQPDDGATDLILVVVDQGQGIWCSDDAVGPNPEVAAAFPAGTYDVWVGNASEGQQVPYQLLFTERRTSAEPIEGTGGQIEVEQLEDQQTAQ